MLRVADVAERLNVSVQCVYQLIESGKLAVHRIGVGRGAIRVSEPDLERFLQASRVGERQPQTERRSQTPKAKLKHIRL